MAAAKFAWQNLTFGIKYGRKLDASYSDILNCSFAKSVKRDSRNSKHFIKTVVLVSKNLRVHHLRSKSVLWMASDFSGGSVAGVTA